MSLIKELWAFMRARKKYWLLPILVMMVLLGALIVLAQGKPPKKKWVKEDARETPEQQRGQRGTLANALFNRCRAGGE